MRHPRGNFLNDRDYREYLENEVDRLLAKNMQLLESLAFYADESEWDDFCHDERMSYCDRNLGTKLGDDLGKTARDAIKDA